MTYTRKCKINIHQLHYTILQELEPVAHRWRQIGLALGLRDSTLEITRARVQPDVYELLGSVIIEWLRANYTEGKYGPPTWRRQLGLRRVEGTTPLLIFWPENMAVSAHT